MSTIPPATSAISIPVDAATALSFGASSEEDRRKIELLLRLRLRELTVARPRPLEAIMDEAGAIAEARGLTSETLEAMLRDG